MSSSKARWADDLDDSDDEQQQQQQPPPRDESSAARLEIPPTHKSRPDAKGIQIVTSYRAHPTNPSQMIKTITKVKITKDTVREHRDVELRRKWKKFGQAALEQDTSNVTIQSRDDVYMEDPHADIDVTEVDDPSKALAGNLNAFWAKQQRRQLERKYDVHAVLEEPAAVQEQGWTQVTGTSSGASSSGKYVPPSQRKGLTGVTPPGSTTRSADDLNTIRVTNISENTTEADLQELFQPFGRISRVYLAKDKETLQSRGFAFVSFVHKEDAARAMEKLQGFGYDHLILKLEWARPSAPKDPASSGTEYRSGYGKALAQDTKEKVSYASNLTKETR
jgi:translation initiation factor 3 subunit G